VVYVSCGSRSELHCIHRRLTGRNPHQPLTKQHGSRIASVSGSRRWKKIVRRLEQPCISDFRRCWRWSLLGARTVHQAEGTAEAEAEASLRQDGANRNNEVFVYRLCSVQAFTSPDIPSHAYPTRVRYTAHDSCASRLPTAPQSDHGQTSFGAGLPKQTSSQASTRHLTLLIAHSVQ
jgi:hypothetical protein